MAIRFYVDETSVAVGRALAHVRDDVTYVADPGSIRRGRPPCPITYSMEDEDWLPIIGANDWIVLTRDKHIRTRPGEIAAVKRHSIRLFAITSGGELNRWDQLDILVRRWGRIEEEAAKGGPLICSITSGAVTPLDLG